MKLLLTSAGVTNGSIARELRRLLHRPTADSTVVVVLASPSGQGNLLADLRNLHQMGWRRIALADLATQKPSQVMRQLHDADVVYFADSDPHLLAYWLDTGLQASAVSGAAGATCAVFSGIVPWFVLPQADFDHWDPSLAEAAGFPLFAIDSQTAISVSHREVAVISEGRWRFLPGAPESHGAVHGAAAPVPTLRGGSSLAGVRASVGQRHWQSGNDGRRKTCGRLTPDCIEGPK